MENVDAAKLLGEAIRDVGVKTGGCRPDVELTGPQLTMLVHDLGDAYLRLNAKAEVLDELKAKESVTTKVERFRDVLMVLCGGVAPDVSLCENWYVENDDESHIALQEWAMNNTVVGWAQGIGVIEAAMTLADNPIEGAGHAD